MISRSLKEQVKEILYWQPYTRNSDIFLWVEIVKKFYWDQFLSFISDLGRYDQESAPLALKHFMLEAPNQDNVKRIRAWFNAPKPYGAGYKFLPTDREVARARKINKDEWEKQLGYEGLKPGDRLELQRQEKHLSQIRREERSGHTGRLFAVPVIDPN
ncbi:MAG: hypothetical protein COY66_05790 [Candidatus Kerfeldbacteria bacterium CG_4_10_14_0_8_um_filter_42_10]|uniref:Uncharacterized protein n=1 Tax=Candidatus Kerfeldbacteria bacterium CG_4_10_14_0_8_um_filter_42_10 TaxID=2014248 RepID=A0A2M7RGY4_9BACT|nr:MAG: hypothetical protein COY66_05790 [Candidatus Kerfeldbacteria bacterium CG_4_10_14_0_8_um_filter_42_10]